MAIAKGKKKVAAAAGSAAAKVAPSGGDRNDKKSLLVKNASVTKAGKPIKKELKAKAKSQNWAAKMESLALQKQQEKIQKRSTTPKSSLTTLGSLQAELDQIKPHVPPKTVAKDEASMSSRQRKQLLLKEREQFKQVMRHPVFRNNPLGTIKTHLVNSAKIQEAMKK